MQYRHSVHNLFDFPRGLIDRKGFARVVLENKDGKYFFSSTGIKGAGMLTSMFKANAIACFPPDISDVKKESIMEVHKIG